MTNYGSVHNPANDVFEHVHMLDFMEPKTTKDEFYDALQEV